MKKMLMVAGRFGDNPRESGYANKLYEAIGKVWKDYIEIKNGGSFDILECLVRGAKMYDIILWFPDISNNYPKLVDKIKRVNYKALLVMSKNNIDNKYSFHELVARALKSKANLLIEFTRSASKIAGTLIDPLGNTYCTQESNIDQLASVLTDRLEKLMEFTRIGSMEVGLLHEGSDVTEVPNELEFFEITKVYAKTFHELVHAANSDRFLGNLSFRCERGFPSFRKGKIIYVSRRNIDKRYIGREGFVPVCSEFVDGKVAYDGEIQPSVDTPVQLMLYKKFKNVNYMLHAHVYVEGAPFTDHVIPCGSIEEYYSIVEKVVDEGATNFAINLKGHGCLLFGNIPDFFKEVKFEARPTPENQTRY